MVFTTIHKRSILYLLITFMLMLLPAAGAAAPQRADINKPTRERVRSNDKKATDKKAANKVNTDSKANANDKKADVKKTNVDKNDSKSVPAADKTSKKDNEKALTNGQNAKPAQDTTSKPAAKPAKKQTKRPVNTDSVRFDGIDVSKHQEYINWGELRKNNRIQYVFIRATVGSDIVDANYKENVRNARKHGFKVGSYHYMTNLSSVNGQFENFRRTVDKNSQDILPMIDVEVRSKWSKQQLRDSLMKFTQLIEDYYGCTPIIYTYETFYKDNLGVVFENFPLFIAKYSNQRPDIGTRAKWMMWQFSETGYFSAVKGNKGLVDLSRFNDGYTINDILYKPGKTKPRTSVRDAVDHKEKPATINATEQRAQESSKSNSKQKAEQQKKAEKQKADQKRAEQQKKADKEARAKERSKKAAQEEAAKKAKEQEEAAKKAKQKADQQKREQARKEAAQKAAKEKAERKAAAQKARQEKAKQDAAKKQNKSRTNKATNVRGALSQSQHNDSIRNAQQRGRKINKSSADND